MTMSGESLNTKAKFYFHEVSTELMNRDWRIPPRPWSELFEKFTLPKRDMRVVWSRMYLNLNYYQTNYLFLFACTLIVFLLRHRWSLFVVGGITAGWVYATSHKPIVINGRRITRKERFYFMAVVTLVVPTVTGVAKHFFKYFLFITAVILLHSVFRHTNIRYKASDIRQQVNDNW